MSNTHNLIDNLITYCIKVPERREKYASAIIMMKNASKFVFDFYPDKELARFSMDCIAQGVNILPYDQFIFEFTPDDGVRVIALFVRDPRVSAPDLRLVANMYWWHGASKFWIWAGTIGIVRNSEHPMGGVLTGDIGLWNVAEKRSITVDEEESAWGQMQVDLMISLGYLGALSSKSTVVESVSVSQKLNRNREAKGKTPLFAHNVVKLLVPKGNKSGRQEMGDLVRASPITHWRRGHIRHWHDGRLIPIPPVIVNAGEEAPMRKEYRASLGKTRTPDANPLETCKFRG